MKFKLYKRRYIYHYRVMKQNYSLSGIAQLHYPIKSQQALDSFKSLVGDTWKENIPSIDNLSYLGRESFINWILHCFNKIV